MNNQTKSSTITYTVIEISDDELGLTIIDNASDRIKRIRQRYLEEKTVISIERARYYTESWKETEGDFIGVRVALAMKNVFKKMNFNVDPDDRIAGTWTEHFLGTPIDIERGLFNQVFAVELDKKKMKRFNLKEKNSAEIIDFKTFKFRGKRWIEHPNKAVDLAVIVLTIFKNIDRLDIGIKPVENRIDDYIASAEWLQKYKVDQGDQIFTLGLVPYLYTPDAPNLVLSRFGTIALLLQNEILLPGGKQKAYFIDCQAFGGNSGGPAYVLIERSESGALIAGWRFALLGVVTEFVPSPLRMQKIKTKQSGENEKFLPLENTGITKVVPIDYLLDIVFSDEQKEFRKKIAKKDKSKPIQKSDEN